MSLYASKAVVKKTIELFCELHECKHCGGYFNELNNAGCWRCWYHPGEYDTVKGCMSCCGEKIRRPNLHNQYSHISPMMSWGPKNSYDLLEPFSKGCKRRDCISKKETAFPKNTVNIEEIASLVPYMDPPLKKRPGFKKTPLSLLKQEPFPYATWAIPPLDKD